jgi:3-oxoacyl-[acyl-carrier protein] reductase
MKPGTVYMITGAAKGIGAAAAQYVVEKGGRVAVCDIDEKSMQDLCRRLGEAAIPVLLDVSKPEEWEQAAEHVWETFGRIDVLVNNAGIGIGGLCYELELSKIKASVDVNLLGVIYGMHFLIPRFLKQGSGHVVNVGSFAAFSPMAGLGIYSATKHAMRAFSHSCDIELADTPVGISLVCPNAVETPMLEDLGKDDKALVVFTQKPMPARKMAEAIVRAAEKKPHEILLPGLMGAFLRIIGLFPGLLKRSMPSALKKGKVALDKRRIGR